MPLLRIGVTFIILNASGTIPDVTDSLYILVKGFGSGRLASSTSRFGILRYALFSFSPENNAKTCVSVTGVKKTVGYCRVCILEGASGIILVYFC